MIQVRPTTYTNRKIIRETYARSAGVAQEAPRLKQHSEPVLNINFGEDAMILVTKGRLVVYYLNNMKVLYTREGSFWDAIFVPNTSFIACVEHDGTLKGAKTLRILDLSKDQFVASVIITYEIEQIKVSRNCICLAGIKEISVMHFPTLKPIFHELAGNGLRVIFDLSYEGLTLAYQTQKKGAVMLQNFSNFSTSKARRKSSDMSKARSPFASLSNKLQPLKKLLQIQAHNQFVSLIKMSPNGSRVATASNKGTIIRIFLTSSGKLWEELRVGYELCKILDMNFYEEGNALCCLTEKSMVYLFNAQLQAMEEQAESEKRGYKIYQQANPKSIFSFLSFLNNKLGNELPFAFYKLIKPEDANSANQKPKEDPKSDHSQLRQSKSAKKQGQSHQILGGVKEQQMMEVVLEEDPSRIVKQYEIKMGSMPDIKDSFEVRQEVQASLQRRVSEAPSQKFNRSSTMKRTKSLLKKFNMFKNKKDHYDHVGKIYNTVSKVFIGGNNFVWAAKGPYIFVLKYDPFNGGQMHNRETIRFC